MLPGSDNIRPLAAVEPAPAHLSATAKAKWDELQEICGGAARPILVSMLEAMDRREQARLQIVEHGAVIKDKFGIPKVSPWMAIERDSTLVMQRAFRLLGFDQEPRDGGGAGQRKLWD